MKRKILLILLCTGALTAQAQPGPGFALRFADTASYVAVPHTSALNAFPLTVTAWVKTTAATGQQGLVNKYVASSSSGWNLVLRDGHVRAWYFVSNTRFVWDGSNGLDGGFIADGAWHQVAFNVDTRGGQLYVDGVLRASRVWNGAPGTTTTSQEMRFGNYPGGVLSFNGAISLDEITVWNAALNQSQVASNLFTPLAGAEANLLAFYRCDEGSGTTVADSAPLVGNNNGSFVGTPAFAPTVVAVAKKNDGGTPRGDCRDVPGATQVKLDWSGQNLVGCKVDVSSAYSRIQRVASDCTTIFYTDLPPYVPRSWSILSQPIGANAQLTVTSNGASLSLPRAGDYTVQLTVCPGGNCSVFEFPGSPSTFLINSATGVVTIRAETELPLLAQTRPVLPPSAMTPTPRLDLTDAERSCRCLGGGGYLNPQWVTVSNWSGAADYELVEGVVARCWTSVSDAGINHNLAFDLDGPHFYVLHDVNVIVSPDPRYYRLLSTKPESESNPHLLGCEAQRDIIPERFRPVAGDRVSLFGFWILDCGHAPFYTEIHPIVGWAVHRNRPVRIPDQATFTFDLVTNTVTSTAGQNLYVPGIITDLWFNSYTGEITADEDTSLAQPGFRAPPPLGDFCVGGGNITSSPIAREYDFNIYLPKNPSQVFAEAGIARPRAPLYLNISNPHNSAGPDPVVTRVTETVNGVVYEFLRVHLDLRGYGFPNYSRRIEAAWIYPKADNWSLTQWRVTLHKLDIFDDLDAFTRFPGADGDWILWMMLPSTDQPWTRILDGFDNAHGTMTFNPPWQTGESDPVVQRRSLELDPQRRLGSDILSYSGALNFQMGGYEADEGEDDGDMGRIDSIVPSVFLSHPSNNDIFAADVSAQKVATLNNGVLSPVAAALARRYLLTCTNKINNRFPIQDFLNPFATAGVVAEGVSGEPPWSPVDPQQIYGTGAALLGDVNNDGFPDVALGTHSNPQAHIFLGGRNGFAPAPFAIVSLPPPPATGLSAPRPTTLVGGDVNGDGIPDVVVGATAGRGHVNLMNVHSNAGAVFAFSGAQLRAGGTFSHSNSLWAVSAGTHSNVQFGFSVAAGDITHDGISDIVVGAPFHSNDVALGRPLGRVFVYFGSPLIHSNMSPNQTLIPPQLDMISDHWFGYSVSMAGDVNGDGFTDVLIGAPRYTRLSTTQGACFLYYGSPTGLVLNTSLLLEGDGFNAQFGYAVAGAGDVDGDGFPDVLVSAPFATGNELTLENGYVALHRGSSRGLIGGAAWLKFGDTGGSHLGLDLGPVGDLNGDGRADIAVAAPGETGPDGLRGRVAYFLGHSNTTSMAETWRSWGVSGVAKLMINSPCCVPFISPCCNTGSTNKVDFNLDGFADALTFDAVGGGDPFARVQLTLGRGQKSIVPKSERFFRSVGSEPYAFQSLFQTNFVANLIASGQTNETRIAALLAKMKNLYLTLQQAGGQPGDFAPLLQRLQIATPTNLFNQYFGDVDLELGAAVYVDCGATNEYTDVLGRRWLPDAPFLATSSSGAQLTVFTGIGPVTNTLPDRYLPDAMLNSERWFNGHIRYQVDAPNGWYTVLLYFSENYPPSVSPALGGTGCAACARLFDLEVEGQRVSAYNQADTALPPSGDGLGRLYTATQVRFDVEVTDGVMDIAVLDRGPGNPPENSAIKGLTILARPNPATKFATRPRIARTTLDGGQFGVLVDPQANLARYLAGEIPLRLQSSSNLTQWATLPNLPEVGANGAFFSLPSPTNRSSFFRAMISFP